MKNRILTYLWASLAIFAISACDDDEGTTPGGDPQASALLYVYNAELPNDPDCDAVVRIATNSTTSEVYLLAEKKADYDTHIASGEASYMDYVVSNGQKVDKAANGEVVDIVLPKLQGEYRISAVAKKGSEPQRLYTQPFTGQTWNDICTGTYQFQAKIQGTFKMASVSTVLQQNGDEPKNYRFKNLFALGKHLAFYKDGRHYQSGEALLRVKPQDTGFTFGNYGSITVADACAMKGENAQYLDNAMDEETNYCYFFMAYYVSAGYLSYDYDEFYPD